MFLVKMDSATLGQYLDYPIQPPPEGMTPNFVNPDSTAYQAYITAGRCLALMVMFFLDQASVEDSLWTENIQG